MALYRIYWDLWSFQIPKQQNTASYLHMPQMFSILLKFKNACHIEISV